ncbi:hypothetical protein PENANT_c206G05267 [Penicillium antarcticum]|uniref:Uncharacterized protein n=1 Tax=Penicillium antarcticum TaxID=416450 RepID=A0A1V6P938_9EURO|nr:uncharacterized protein N7508_000001 [Penicillium antarcticum]KAJ5319718.1 hypothetical protein N7508_000001 [Penicillium antarcticum]OQD73529.1 hypothetical protein PENANT_c206G05267 [Penicillium antarcticum]
MASTIDGVAVVTGAGSGIGRAVALAYAAEGARGVVVVDLNYEAAMETARRSKPIATNPAYQALAIAVDVTDISSVDSMVQNVVETFGRIDYNVNSAGIGVQQHRAVDEVDSLEMNRFWQVNVMGTLNCIQAITKVMKTQSIATVGLRGRTREVGRGVILNVGSCNSYIATPQIVPYTTTKHALLGLTKTAALDNAPHKIRVNAICPGWVNTPMVDAAVEGNPNLPTMMKTIIPMERIAEVEEIADVIVFMTSPRASYVTGAGWIVDGGTTLQVQTC